MKEQVTRSDKERQKEVKEQHKSKHRTSVVAVHTIFFRYTWTIAWSLKINKKKKRRAEQRRKSICIIVISLFFCASRSPIGVLGFFSVSLACVSLHLFSFLGPSSCISVVKQSLETGRCSVTHVFEIKSWCC